MRLLLGIAAACIAGALIGYIGAIAILAALVLWFLSAAWGAASRIGRGI